MHFMDILHAFKSFDINRSEPFTYKHRLCRINIAYTHSVPCVMPLFEFKLNRYAAIQ